MPGKICCIYGCHNTSRYLEKWRDTLCEIHGTNRRFCVCLEPFRLIPFPTERKDPELRKEWINIVNINRSQKGDKSKHYLPSESSRICSEHFESPESRLPSLNLFYDPKAAQKRKSTAKKKEDKNVKKHKRECLSENKNFIDQEENVPNSVQFESAIDFSGDENETSTNLDHDNSDNNDCDMENIRFDYMKETDRFPAELIPQMKDFKKKKKTDKCLRWSVVSRHLPPTSSSTLVPRHIYKKIPTKTTINCSVETQTDPEVPDDPRIDQPQTTACSNVPNDCLDFRKTLYQFHLNGFLCDTIIRTKDSVMKAHSCVLAAKSSRLLTSVFLANHENGSIVYDLDFSDYETIVVQMALDYIYLGEVTDVGATEEHVVESRFSKFFSLVKTLGVPLDEFQQFLNKSVGCPEKNTNDDVGYTCHQDVGSKAHQDVGSQAHQDVGSKAYLNIGLEALRSVISKACQDTGSKDNQDVGSKARQDVGSKAQQDVGSKARQDVGSKARQDVGSKARQDVGSKARQDVGSIAHQDNGSKGHQDIGTMSHLNFGLKALRSVILKACQDVGSKDNQDVGSLAPHQFSIVETVLPPTIPPSRTSIKIGNTIFILPTSQESNQTHDLPLNSKQASPTSKVTTEKHICEKCGMEFPHETDLQMHTWYVHVAVLAKYDKNSCSICSRGFKHVVSLDTHMKRKHGIDISQPQPTDQAPLTSNGTSKQAPSTKQALPTSEVTTEKHICERCGLEFLDQTDLRMHTYHVHLSTFEVYDNYVCSICNRGFKYVGTMNAHMQKKHGEAPEGVQFSPKEFLCDLCGKFFSSRCQVEQHRNRVHSNLSSYKCVVCGRSFKSRAGMHFHTRIHFNEKNFACPTCAKCFRTKREVHTHMETHKAVKRKGFSCRICNRQFASLVYMKRHMMMKHHSVCVADQDLGPEAEELFGSQSQQCIEKSLVQIGFI